MDGLLRLFPGNANEIPFKGAYLEDGIRSSEAGRKGTFVYANFIASLDGRIAVERPDGGGLAVPSATANERDWRLFQELAAQADVIISSGRYLRDWAAGRAQEILRVDDDRFADLRKWRARRGLPAHPDIVVLSHQLDFTVPDVLQQGGRRAIIFTDADAPADRISAIEKQVGPVQIARQGGWGGQDFASRLFDLGYRFIFSAAGPRILHMLLSGNVLNRQYVTLAPVMLGGEQYSTLLEGAQLHPPAGFRLRHVYLDPMAFNGAGQLFLCYESGASSSKID